MFLYYTFTSSVSCLTSESQAQRRGPHQPRRWPCQPRRTLQLRRSPHPLLLRRRNSRRLGSRPNRHARHQHTPTQTRRYYPRITRQQRRRWHGSWRRTEPDNERRRIRRCGWRLYNAWLWRGESVGWCRCGTRRNHALRSYAIRAGLVGETISWKKL
jgi:hypothetical protein